MGKEKYIKDVEKLFAKSPVADSLSIARIVNKRRKVRQYAKQLIRNLILKGRIKRLTKGYYTTYDNPSLGVFCFKPSYLGLQDALSFHDLWEQETIPVIITAKKVRQGIRKIMGANVMIRRVSKKYVFGFDYYEDGEFYLPYSDIEKTFIDMIHFKETLSHEATKNIIKKADRKKLRVYLKPYPPRTRKLVMGYLKSGQRRKK